MAADSASVPTSVIPRITPGTSSTHCRVLETVHYKYISLLVMRTLRETNYENDVCDSDDDSVSVKVSVATPTDAHKRVQR